jgi:hypothetical protein
MPEERERYFVDLNFEFKDNNKIMGFCWFPTRVIINNTMASSTTFLKCCWIIISILNIPFQQKNIKYSPPKQKILTNYFYFTFTRFYFALKIFFSQKNISENNIISFQLAMVVVGTINGTTTFPSKF